MVIGILIILGLALGSFVNALVWRVWQQSLPRKKRAASDNELSISRGRSICPSCQHSLAWYDLLPVVSWLALKGKCRYCHKLISWQYPLVELATAGSFVASYVFWPVALSDKVAVGLFALWLVGLVMLVALAVYDLRWMLLPNRIVFPLTAVSLLYALIRANQSDGFWHSVILSFASLLIAGGIFYLLFQVSAGRWIGGGDVKLGFALGLFIGQPAEAFLMLFVASLLGMIFGLTVMLLGNRKVANKIPFGPFLIMATIIVMLFGGSIISWYTDTFLSL